MLLYWLVGSDVLFLCQSLISLNFHTRCLERDSNSFLLYMKLVGIVSMGRTFVLSVSASQSFCISFFRARLIFLPEQSLKIHTSVYQQLHKSGLD